MKGTTVFVARLLVVVALVAGVVAIGYGWKHSPAASVVADRRGSRDSRARSVDPSRRIRSDGPGARGNHGISLGNVSDLVQTLTIELAILGGVVLIDQRLRSRRVTGRLTRSRTG